MALTAKKVYAILKRQISDMEVKLNSPVRYKGTVATADLLPLNPDIGDMYNIESKSVYGEAGMNVAWNGVVWDTMGAPIDMSLYLTKEEAESVIQRLVTEYFEKNPVKPGATTEQAQQIEQNKTDVASLKTETNSLKESISNKITKFYASSHGETHLADSDNGKIMDMMVYGKSEQKQYSGKNLVNVPEKLEVIGHKNYTIAVEDKKTYTITLSQTLKATSPTGTKVAQHWFNFYDSSGEILKQGDFCNMAFSNVGEVLTKTQALIPPEGAIELVLDISAYFDDSPTLITNYMQVELGSEPTTYEPYTGGQPSPSPDYPQEIKSVVNPTVKVVGKNLLNPTLFKGDTFTANGVTYKNVTDETGSYFLLDGTADSEIDFWIQGDTVFTYDGSADKLTISVREACPDSYYLCIGSIERDFKGTKAVTTSSKVLWFYIHVLKGAVINNYRIYVQVEAGDIATAYEPYHEQTVTLPYTLNAIPVSSGGNVTIDGQQYVSDYFDVERGKLVRMVYEPILHDISKFDTSYQIYVDKNTAFSPNDKIGTILCDKLCPASTDDVWNDVVDNAITLSNDQNRISFRCTSKATDTNSALEFIKSCKIYIALAEPEEIALTPEEIAAFKALATYYPTTNISVNSNELDGYTVFNYPISIANGWNYVKQQIGDTREYIYDMDARTQGTDLQAAEAYVNSEYAVALTELEV